MAISGVAHSSAEGVLKPLGSRRRKVNSRTHIAMQRDGDRRSTRTKMKNRIKKILRIKWKGAPDDPLISRNSGNVFHDQALIQLASVYESLQLGDSREAVTQVYDLGERLFGSELFGRAVRHGRLTGLTA